jgi:hypothetical protein
MKKRPLHSFLILVLLLILAIPEAFATHNRAGEITYVWVAPNTLQVTIATWTKASSVAADRDSLTFTGVIAVRTWKYPVSMALPVAAAECLMV